MISQAPINNAFEGNFYKKFKNCLHLYSESGLRVVDKVIWFCQLWYKHNHFLRNRGRK